MLIKIADYHYGEFTPKQQFRKVVEEWNEFVCAALGNKDIEIREEAFDLIQSVVGYLVTRGADLTAASEAHIAKLEARQNQCQQE